jgi:uncharacterized membrane protein
MLVGVVATLAAGLFAGAAIYINLVEHPARLETGACSALAEFAPSYRRATVMQVSLAIAGFLSALVAWWATADTWWLVGGALLVSVIPFTAVAILPTNKRLLDPATSGDPVMAHQLLARWGRLHLVRSILSLAALIMFLFLLGR